MVYRQTVHNIKKVAEAKRSNTAPDFQPKWYEKILGFFAAFLMGAW